MMETLQHALHSSLSHMQSRQHVPVDTYICMAPYREHLTLKALMMTLFYLQTTPYRPTCTCLYLISAHQTVPPDL